MDVHYENIRDLIENNVVTKKVNEFKNNYHDLKTFHSIGQQLVEAQKGERAGYGENLLETYSVKLEKEFGSKYNLNNLTRYRSFYLTFPIVDALRQQLTWTHYRSLLSIKDESKRIFTIRQLASLFLKGLMRI